MGLFDMFKSKELEELFKKALEEKLSKPPSEIETYDEIVANFILYTFNINSFMIY